MKKQLMAGMMAASMALSLAACGGSAASSAAPAADSTSGAASTSTAASTSSNEQVTLRFAWWGGDERANATMEVINKFMEENPNIKIEAEYGSSDGYHDKLATQLASGTAADIVQIDPETMPTFVSTGDYFLDYKDYDFDLSNFDPNYIGLRVNGNYDGKQLGLPTGIAGPALVVNEELAEKYGIDKMVMVGILDGINDSLKQPNPIETMDETTELSLDYDKEKLYYNMVGAKAEWLYTLPQWDALLTPERRKELYKEQKSSTTIVKDKKIGRNDPCPCGSGKKYKYCCGRNK